MPVDAHSVLAAWENFYVITGSASAALTGLVFVVITLIGGERTEVTSEGMATFTTPTVLHFCAGLLISVVVEAPWHSLLRLSVVLGIIGLYGTLHSSVVAIRTSRLTTYRAELDDWVWYSLVPLLAYVAILVAALRLTTTPSGVLFVLAAATMTLIFVGIRNAWDVVSYLAVHRDGGPDAGGE